jgi:hypothetical protein
MGKVLKRLATRSEHTEVRRDKGDTGVPVPENFDWIIWRLIMEKVATLKEIETYYDYADVLDAHLALDLIHEAEKRQMKAMENK